VWGAPAVAQAEAFRSDVVLIGSGIYGAGAHVSMAGCGVGVYRERKVLEDAAAAVASAGAGGVGGGSGHCSSSCGACG
jgi:hypothetical protein